jgi:hypothetical protein
MPLGQVLRSVFMKIKDSPINPWLKYPALALIAGAFGYATIMGIPL